MYGDNCAILDFSQRLHPLHWLLPDPDQHLHYTADLVPGGDACEGLCEGGAVDQRAAGAVTQVHSQLRVRGEPLVARVHLMKTKISQCCVKKYSRCQPRSAAPRTCRRTPRRRPRCRTPGSGGCGSRAGWRGRGPACTARGTDI